jgi:hypothetical protein
MGSNNSKLSEEDIDDYQDLTYLSKAEILRYALLPAALLRLTKMDQWSGTNLPITNLIAYCLLLAQIPFNFFPNFQLVTLIIVLTNECRVK